MPLHLLFKIYIDDFLCIRLAVTCPSDTDREQNDTLPILIYSVVMHQLARFA